MAGRGLLPVTIILGKNVVPSARRNRAGVDFALQSSLHSRQCLRCRYLCKSVRSLLSCGELNSARAAAPEARKPRRPRHWPPKSRKTLILSDLLWGKKIMKVTTLILVLLALALGTGTAMVVSVQTQPLVACGSSNC